MIARINKKYWLQKGLLISLAAGAFPLLSGCSTDSEAAVDSAAVAELMEQETADIRDAMQKLNAAESSRAQVIADSIAAVEQSQAEAAAEASRAAHAQRLQELCAGTNLVPGMVCSITENDLPVLHQIFQGVRLVGDSRVAALEVLGLMPSNELSYYIGAHIGTMFETTQQCAYMYPRKVLFFLGVNDVTIYKADSQVFIEKYKELINSFLAINPNCKVYVHAASPVLQVAIDEIEYRAHLPEFSQAIYQMCVECGYGYVDAATDITPADYFGDGIHFTKEFYLRWLQGVANQMGLWDDVTP